MQYAAKDVAQRNVGQREKAEEERERKKATRYDTHTTDNPHDHPPA